MAVVTKIEWADGTFNGWMGCTRVSPACDDCYAARSTPVRRFGLEWGAGKSRQRTSAANWQMPVRWNKEPFVECPECHWRGEAKDCNWHGEQCPNCNMVVDSARRRVFSASLSDWLDNEVPIEWLVDLLDLVRRTPNLDWLLLSKRIGSWRKRLEAARDSMRDIEGALNRGEIETLIAIEAWLDGNPPANVWIGSTLVNRPEMLRDGPKLKQVPAPVLFWSVEPMLGELGEIPRELLPDWVIVGGESGPNARPMHPDWVLSLSRQCAAAGVPLLFKQWGEWLPINQQTEQFFQQFSRPNRKALPHEDQAAIDESYGCSCTVKSAVIWNDGSVREITEPMAFLQGKGAMTVLRVGKDKAGRMLFDRPTHLGPGYFMTQYPEPRP